MTQITTRFFREVQVLLAVRPAPYASDAMRGERWGSTMPHVCGAEGTHSATGICPGRSSTKTESWYVLIGNERAGVTSLGPDTYTNALDVAGTTTAQAAALWRWQTDPLMPYWPEAWQQALDAATLHDRYPSLVRSLQQGFVIGIPHIMHTRTPPNGSSIDIHQTAFQ